jgi:hypothetical protein
MSLPALARLLLLTSAALIALGGVYDVLAPRLPANLAAMCSGDERACRLARELLRALGGALVAIGLAVGVLVVAAGFPVRPLTLSLILLLVVPSESVNAFCMYRVGSPYYIPLAFVLLTCAGVLMAWPGMLR